MDKITNKEILERWDAYRSIEINNLWQRSVFLGSFMLLGYTGYGVLLNNWICNEIYNLERFHFLASVLASLNIIFSILWITMAKGSKAWYESYENALSELENEFRIYGEKKKTIKLKVGQKGDCLFSTKAGGYSPAKINIAIGQISLICWTIALLFHVLKLYLDFCEFDYIQFEIFTLIIIVILILKSDWIKSSYFSNNRNDQQC